MHRRFSDSLKYIQKHMAYMQHKMTLIDLRYIPFSLAPQHTEVIIRSALVRLEQLAISPLGFATGDL